MSAEAPRNSDIVEPLDLISEVSSFIGQQIKTEAEIATQKDLEREQRIAQERNLLEAGNRRSREIAELSSIREILQQAEIGLVEHYGEANVTLLEEETPHWDMNWDGNRFNMSEPAGRKDYWFRLAWEQNAWFKEKHHLWGGILKGERHIRYNYIDVVCSGWDNCPLAIQRTCLERDQWQDKEELKRLVLEAIKTPLEALPNYKPPEPERFGTAHG